MITVEVGGLEKLKRLKSMKNYLIKLGGRFLRLTRIRQKIFNVI